jgi:hypothetical protein
MHLRSCITGAKECRGTIQKPHGGAEKLRKTATLWPKTVLAIMYRRGEGVSPDYAEAVNWYRKSAAQGYPEAKYDLGYMYYYGYGVPQDRGEATRLFREAAAGGDEYAKRALECLRRGTSIDPGAGLRGLQ